MKLIVYFLFSFSIIVTAQLKQSTSSDSLKTFLIREGIQSYFKKDVKKLSSITVQIDSLYTETNDSTLLAKYFQYKAMYNELKYKKDSAFYYYHKSKSISKKLNDSLEVGRRLLSLSNIQREAKDYLGSEVSSIEALQYLEPIKSYKYLANIYNNLGLISMEINKNKESSKFYKLALKANTLTDQSKRKETTFLYIINNMGLSYQRQNKQKKALEYFREGLAFHKIKQKYPLHYCLLFENFTFSKYVLRKEKEPIKNYIKVLNIRNSMSSFYNVSTTYLNIAFFYKDNNEIKRSQDYTFKALKYAKKTHNNKRWLEALYLLSETTTGKKSKEYLKEYITLNDSLFQQERLLKNQFAKIRYETDKKEKENESLKKQNEEHEAKIIKQKQETTISWLVALVSFLGLLISVLFFVLKRRKLLYQSELQKTQATYEERDRIAKELHDGILGRLFGTRFGLGFVKVVGEKEALKKYNNFLDELQEIEKEIREVSHALSHPLKKNAETFISILNKLLKDKSDIGGFTVTKSFCTNVEWNNVAEEIKHNLYRIIQELLQNTIKHAKAKHVILTIKSDNQDLIIEMADNGIGFKKEKGVRLEGIGLNNIKSRIDKLKGSFKINSGKGTKVIIHIPLKTTQ